MTPLEFKAARKRLRMSQQALADALGRHRSIVARYEAGVYPVPKSVELALEALEGRDEYVRGVQAMATEVKQLCRDFSDLRDRPYMGDVTVAIDALAEQVAAAHSAGKGEA